MKINTRYIIPILYFLGLIFGKIFISKLYDVLLRYEIIHILKERFIENVVISILILFGIYIIIGIAKSGRRKPSVEVSIKINSSSQKKKEIYFFPIAVIILILILDKNLVPIILLSDILLAAISSIINYSIQDGVYENKLYCLGNIMQLSEVSISKNENEKIILERIKSYKYISFVDKYKFDINEIEYEALFEVIKIAKSKI